MTNQEPKLGSSSDKKNKFRLKVSSWQNIGPLGKNIDRVFSNLVYQKDSQLLPLTVYCSQDLTIVLADTKFLGLDELDITVEESLVQLTVISELGPDSAIIEEGYFEQEDAFYSHTIPLFHKVDVSQMGVSLEDNILRIELPHMKREDAGTSLVYLQ